MTIADFKEREPRVLPDLLSPQRRKVLAFIVSMSPSRPSPAAIAAHMGWRNETSVRDVLGTLWQAGYLTQSERGGGRGRQTIWQPTNEAFELFGKVPPIAT